jgi:hypothetical protein
MVFLIQPIVGLLILMEANPDNGWIQIESIRLLGFEFKARKATVGGNKISEGRRLIWCCYDNCFTCFVQVLC